MHRKDRHSGRSVGRRWEGVKAPPGGCVLAGFFVALVSFACSALAQGVFLETRQERVAYNLQSQRGVPLSSTTNTPHGSDGRIPLPGALISQGHGYSTSPATVHQFQTLTAFSGGLVNGSNNVSGDGKVVLALRSVRVGTPYISQNVAYLFGAIIPRPITDEAGKDLSKLVPPQRPEDYWFAEPFTTNSHVGDAFYWSPHARAVFAVNAGQIHIKWKRTFPTVGVPSDFLSNSNSYYFDGLNYYPLLDKRYLVSDSAVKPPRTMYWTQNTFHNTGKAVNVPSALVSAVNVIFNSSFPERVDHEFVPVGSIPIVPATTNHFEETRTLWFDAQQNQIYAYNREGRVFVEFLGDTQPDGVTKKFLGFEIVNVYQQPAPSDVQIDLGERLNAFQDARDDSALLPSPIPTLAGVSFAYRKEPAPGAEIPTYYATRETVNQNDFLVHWMEQGILGLRWPFILVRYKLQWPTDLTHYSHYIRPLVSTEDEAKATAVPLPTDNIPTLVYQDPLDKPRAFLTADFKFYTFLDAAHPAHRSLLHYTVGVDHFFERVFSWLDLNLVAGNFSNSVATNLTGWNPTNQTLTFPPGLQAPKVVNQIALVGQRINPPVGEIGSADTNYLSGYIFQPAGTSFSTTAYIDPFSAGFDKANLGSIIPVNAIPGANHLEVLWFRTNSPPHITGFKQVDWPAVIGQYTLNWPTNADQIVLASNAGSGPLPSLEAKGNLYIQNDRNLPGYNPNEEHALMQGGQVYALRDDLNVVGGSGFSSAPFVLLEYLDSDSRPSIHAFLVRREAPEQGITFEYSVPAGQILQPPMPLGLLEQPLAPKLIGAPPKNLNHEVKYADVDSLTVGGVPVVTSSVPSLNLLTHGEHPFRAYHRIVLSDLYYTQPVQVWYYPTNADEGLQHLSGYVSTNQPLILSAPPLDEPLDTNRWRYGLATSGGTKPGDVVIIANHALQLSWGAIVRATNVVGGANYVEVDFGMARSPEAQTASDLIIPVSAFFPSLVHPYRLTFEPIPVNSPDPVLYGAFTFQDRKGNTWVYRGPHNAQEQPTMAMRYYYKTLPGFFFPGQNPQPDIGTITPYLRAPGALPGSYAGDPVHGVSASPQNGDDNAFVVQYHPVWPTNAPILNMAESLTVPKRGLPAVRGQTSVEILYQQSLLPANSGVETVALHDPTREKTFALSPSPTDSGRLGKIPDSIKTQTSRGKTYFPRLPPHLANRFFFDPNRGPAGALVFNGEFVDDIVGDKYLLLNVLSTSDANYLKGLCLDADPLKGLWSSAIDFGLATSMEHFTEDPNKPGTYIPDPAKTISWQGNDLARVSDQDVAVDSYALTAVGPGVGFVTLVMGDGLAFTPVNDPVSVEIIKVVNSLYQGEVKIVQSSNPLSEQLTLQQVTDLAGQASQYGFQWLISAPVDGGPPPVYQNTPTDFIRNQTWNHLPFPLPTDTLAAIPNLPTTAPGRVRADVRGTIIPVATEVFASVTSTNVGQYNFAFAPGGSNLLVLGNRVTLQDTNNSMAFATVTNGTTATNLVVVVDAGQTNVPGGFLPAVIRERVDTNQPQTVVFANFSVVPTNQYPDLWISLSLDPGLGAKVYVDSQLVVTANTGLNDSASVPAPGDLATLANAYPIDASLLKAGSIAGDGTIHHTVLVQLFSTNLSGTTETFDLRLQSHRQIDLTAAPGSPWLPLDAIRYPDGVRAVLGGSADVRALSDNYLIMRYRATNPGHASFDPGGGGWSRWTDPQLAEGWIKRVLAGINPFNQRVTDLFNNSINTDASLLTQAGHRWEGDVALNLDVINSYGLIEIYETVLRRGRSLSIDGGINYGPANQALLLAAGYLSDLYMLDGDEAWADAANPTISIGTKDSTYGDLATSMFTFQGQVGSLLEQQLAMLRGRDDFIQPGVETPPVYNRLYWNYTRGIAAGEVIYALNYDIQPNPDAPLTGAITAADAAHMYPMGHGDAYGHYLTSIKGFYSLLMSPSFSWLPEIEAVTILGKPVSVGYQNERKFAKAAAALARAGKQIFDLSWRSEYTPGHPNGWDNLAPTRVNSSRSVTTTRYWGSDHWANRVGQGNYVNWVVGNALVPDVDPDPLHEGIQKIDRTTIPELQEMPSIAKDLQQSLDDSEGGLNPLGLAEGSIAFDINPQLVTAADPVTHFEQVYARALTTLNNAVSSFNDAKDVTRLMRSQKDSLADYQTQISSQEMAYTNTLIEYYGTPYPDDIGPGKTYPQGYAGPDLVHYMYVDNTDVPGITGSIIDSGTEAQTFHLDIQKLPVDWWTSLPTTFDSILTTNAPGYTQGAQFVTFTLDSRGFFAKPTTWTGTRQSPGQLQQAISEIEAAHQAFQQSLDDYVGAKNELDKAIALFKSKVATHETVETFKVIQFTTETFQQVVDYANDVADKAVDLTKSVFDQQLESLREAIPTSLIVGLADGGDELSAVRAAVKEARGITDEAIDTAKLIKYALVKGLDVAVEKANKAIDLFSIDPLQWNDDIRKDVSELGAKLDEFSTKAYTVDAKSRNYDDAKRKYQALVAKADRLQVERQTFRQRAATVIQGYRTRDAAFRLFRNEKLERYKTLFDLASKYALLAANAYDYETGLLNTDQGRAFVQKIVGSRALGVVRDGQPQFAGSDTGDPGLSSALAEMKADWDVLKGRLGFNNPDAYGTTASLRTENYRILPGTDGDSNWADKLRRSRMNNLLDDQDVQRYCLQINPGDGSPVPGIVIPFSTTVAPGRNIFGQVLAGGDHRFSQTSFATKIFAVGVAFEGYKGMDDPGANGNAVGVGGGSSPSDPSVGFLNPDFLAANPDVYLIPVGVDSMRSPPLGDSSEIRTWTVADVAIPVPFNIGGSDFSSKPLWQSAQSLTEPLFGERKHQAFRPVASASAFAGNVFSVSIPLQRSQYTNSRLIGRSVWNSQWKIVIPGTSLLNDPNDGLDRFIRTVKDVKLYFQTYSYSGN